MEESRDEIRSYRSPDVTGSHKLRSRGVARSHKKNAVMLVAASKGCSRVSSFEVNSDPPFYYFVEKLDRVPAPSILSITRNSKKYGMFCNIISGFKDS